MTVNHISRHPVIRLKLQTQLLLCLVGGLMARDGGSLTAYGQTAARDSGGHPVVLSFSYTGELVENAAGGTRRGITYDGGAGVQGTLLLPRLVGWHGARFYVFVLDTHGGSPSDFTGDIQGVSNLQAPATVRLEEAWLQQNFLQDRLSWLVGRYDLNSEFYRLQSAGLFVNSSFGIGPEFAQSGLAGPSIFPNTAVGTRVEFKPWPNAVWRAAVLDGVPVDHPGDGVRLFAPGDGLLLVSELALLRRPGAESGPRHPRFRIGRGPTRPYEGKVALGAWYYTAKFADLVDTLAGGEPLAHRGSGGAYLIADRTLWSAGPEQSRALTGFVQLGLGDGRVNQISDYVGGGLTLSAPFPSRAQDQLGLAVAAARSGSHYQRAQAAAGAPAASGETTLELTYLAQLGSFLVAQPDVQYVIRPGGTGALANAFVAAVRVAVSH